MPEALCLLCGSLKAAVDSSCSECGLVPREEELDLAHLFSAANLDREELMEAGARIAAGERPAPKKMKRDRALEPGLEFQELWLLVLANFLLTPILGFATWWGWRTSRPRAARQVLWMSASIALLLGGGWMLLFFQVG